MKLSVIIPVYNERETIAEVIERVEAVKLNKEIIVVDDGSTDGTVEILRGRKKDGVLIVHESKINSGKGSAVRIGLKYVTGDIVIIQDADLELNPNEFYQLIGPILEGKTKVVYGSRFMRKNPGIPLLTLLANKFLVLLTNLLYQSSLTDMETAYKVFSSEVLNQIQLNCVGFELEPEITAKFIKAGFHIMELPIEYHPRSVVGGKKINWRDGVKAILTLIKYRFVN
jgi:glycosyltransferase involved in cell wall biosynthesis